MTSQPHRFPCTRPRRLTVAVMFLAGLIGAAGCESKELTAACAAVDASNVDEVRAWLDKGGVDLNADQRTTGVRCRPFHEAMLKVVPKTVTPDQRALEIVRLMLDKGADVNGCWAQGSGGRSGVRQRPTTSRSLCPIEYAARSQSMDFVRLVMERGARIRSGAGSSALKVAAADGDLEMVRTLLDAGAEPNEVAASQGDEGSEGTALGAAVVGVLQRAGAAEEGQGDAVIALLEARPGAREFSRPSALSGVASATARIVQGQGGLTEDEQLFMAAARRGDLESVEAGLTKGLQVDRLGDDNLTALMRAAAWNRVAVVDALLKRGANPNLMNDARTALHLAAYRGHPEVITHLVAAKADLNARFSDNDPTPLFAAVQMKRLSAIRTLIDLGANTTLGDSTNTVLEYAIEQTNAATVSELLKGGKTPVNARHPLSRQWPIHRTLWCKTSEYNVAMIKAVIAAGADLSAVDENNDTPLASIARRRPDDPSREFLRVCYDAQAAVLRAAGSK